MLLSMMMMMMMRTVMIMMMTIMTAAVKMISLSTYVRTILVELLRSALLPFLKNAVKRTIWADLSMDTVSVQSNKELAALVVAGGFD